MTAPGTASRLFRGNGFSMRRRCHRIVTYAIRLPSPGGTAIRSGYCRESGGCSFCWVLVDRVSSSTPSSKLIMVQTAVRKLPVGDPKSPEAMALWYAIVAQYGHR